MSTPKNKFIAFYTIPASVMADWGKTDETTRKAAEEKMKAEWQAWMGKNSKVFTVTEVCGKTKKVTASGVADTRNDICLYSFVEAASHEEAVNLFKNHPHLQIPQATIEVMALRSM